MTESERIAEWVRFYKASSKGYAMNALFAVLETDGEKMLSAVLKALKLERSTDLLIDAKARQ